MPTQQDIAERLTAAVTAAGEQQRLDVQELELCAAVACDWARSNGAAVKAQAASAGPLSGAQQRAARRELRRREQSLRSAMLDARGVPLWARLLAWIVPPPWGTIIQVINFIVPLLIERWSERPEELYGLATSD